MSEAKPTEQERKQNPEKTVAFDLKDCPKPKEEEETPVVGEKRKRVTPTKARDMTAQGEHSRKIAVAVDLSDESSYALQWAVKNYLRPSDFVVLLHVRPTSVLYGADWGASDAAVIAAADKEAKKKMEDDFDALTLAKTQELAKPMEEAGIAYKTHIVKDHDMKERICLEVGISSNKPGKEEETTRARLNVNGEKSKKMTKKCRKDMNPFMMKEPLQLKVSSGLDCLKTTSKDVGFPTSFARTKLVLP